MLPRLIVVVLIVWSATFHTPAIGNLIVIAQAKFISPGGFDNENPSPQGFSNKIPHPHSPTLGAPFPPAPGCKHYA